MPKSEVELEVSLPADFLESSRKKAISNFAISLETPGFRKGHVPENIVIEKIGENGILEEAVDILLKEHFPKIVEEKKLDIIGRPKISVTKLALGNPVEFKAAFAVIPEFELPDYRAIARSAAASAKADKKEEASEKEISDVLLQIRRNKAHFDWHNSHPEEKGHNHPEIKDEDLPELNDEFAKSAGNFKDVEELKAKVKENIETEKKYREIEKKRAEIMEALVKNTKIDLPDILVESETEKSLAQMKDDVAKMGGNWEEYLAHAKKTDLSAEALAKAEDDIKKDFKGSSEKKAKVQLIFNRIAEAEKLQPNKEILENEVKEIMAHYPNTSETNARIYVATILLNQEVLKLLEQQ